jgi:ubiquinone/menaquinone biosynthesis C-methylase UbiE
MSDMGIVANVIRHVFRISKPDTPRFWQWLATFNQSLHDRSPLIGEIMRDISDDEVIYQKGEGAEMVYREKGRLAPQTGIILMSKYFIARRVELVRHATSDLDRRTVLDVGATSDLIFRYLNKKGVALNISPQAVDYMRDRGIEAVVGDACQLPFPDNSFDYVLCYQTVEHMENPVQCLRELGRVARERVFVTVPNTAKTIVCASGDARKGIHRWHFIEFSPPDFRVVLRRAGLRVRSEEVIRCVERARTPRQHMFHLLHRNHHWMRGFAHYVLEPRRA